MEERGDSRQRLHVTNGSFSDTRPVQVVQWNGCSSKQFLIGIAGVIAFVLTVGVAIIGTRLAASSDSTTTTTLIGGSFTCDSDYTVPAYVSLDKKGLCVDDTTFWHCPDKMLSVWPNMQKAETASTGSARVKSLRLFAPWRPAWGDDAARQRAWQDLSAWVSNNNAKVLIGTDVTCQKDVDDQIWQWNLDLVKLLGKEHIMGFAIGNDMDLYYTKTAATGWSQHCIDELWQGGRYWHTLQERVADIDKAGFSNLPVTTAWASTALDSRSLPETPWKEKPGEAMVNTLVTNAYKKWPSRWVWSFNIYGIWDRKAWPTTADNCESKTEEAASISYTKNMIKAYRESIKATTGSDTAPIWIGESGWSSPLPEGCGPFDFCKDFGSVSTMRKAYEQFLSWDLTVEDGIQGADHAFYFSMRDALDTGAREGFGLIANCETPKCKIHAGDESSSTQINGFENGFNI